MVFIIGLSCGLFLGFKIKGAVIFYKETKNIKYIESVVKTVLGKEPITIIEKKEPKKVQEDEELQKEHVKLQGSKFRLVRDNK